MAIPLPQPIYFQPFNALANGMMTGQQINRNALLNNYQQMVNQFYPQMQNAQLQNINTQTQGNQIANQYAPQRYQADIGLQSAQANLANTQANYYPNYVQAMGGRFSSVIQTPSGNYMVVNRGNGQAYPVTVGGNQTIGQPQIAGTPNALYNQYAQGTLPNVATQTNALSPTTNAMMQAVPGFAPRPGGMAVLPNGQVVRSPTVSNLSNTQNRLTAVNESEPLVNQFVQGYQPYNSLYGSKIGVIKDSILANFGDQSAQQRLQNLVASELIKQPAAGALVRSATGAAPTQVELQDQEETLAPYEIYNSLIPSSIRNAGNLQGAQALRQAADVASQPMYQGYAQPTVPQQITPQQAATQAASNQTYSVNSPEVLAAAKQLKVSPQQVMAYLQARGIGG